MDWLKDINIATSIIDLLLSVFLIYYTYKRLKKTFAIPILSGIAIIFLVYQFTKFFGFVILSGVLGFAVNGGAIAILIIFQPELRKFLLRLGSINTLSYSRLKKQFLIELGIQKESFYQSYHFTGFVQAVEKFSRQKTGALIVWEQNQSLNDLFEEEDILNANLNALILESIFFKNSPLHDGAVIIKDQKIKAAKVLLPLSDNDLPHHLGTRHRAALGVSERYDCIVVVVSEETGAIHVAHKGEIKHLPKESFA